MGKYARSSVIFGLCTLIIVGSVFLQNNKEHFQTLDQKISVINKSYASEVKNPKWSLEKADLIIIGDIINKETAQEGVDRVHQNTVVFTDTNIKIKQLIKDKTKEAFKEGDIITVRLLGGTTENLKLIVDTENIFSEEGEVLLCLADGAQFLQLPTTDNKKFFSIVGGIHGVYDIKEDGIVTRKVINDSFKLKDLMAEAQIIK